MVIYRYTKDHKPCESVFASPDEAVMQAVRDMDTSHIYPREITQVIMDRDAIKAAAEQLAA